MTWINIAGGIMLILFGVRFLRKSLGRLFGAGLGMAVLTPSSTTISALAVANLLAKGLGGLGVLLLIPLSDSAR